MKIMKFLLFCFLSAYAFAITLNMPNMQNAPIENNVSIEDNISIESKKEISLPIAKETIKTTKNIGNLNKATAEKNRRKPIAPIEKMIGQMIAVGFDGVRSTDEWAKTIREQIKTGAIGSIVIYARNIVSPQQLRSLNESMHYAGASLPLWIMVDQEGGMVQRLGADKKFSSYPSAKKIAKSSPQNAEAVYRNLACELRGYAINFNLAPVVDLDIEGSVISRDGRAFSDDAKTVAIYAERFVKAHNSCGVWTAIKHFPGQGGAQGDPHFENSAKNIEADEIEPFKILIGNNRASAVMISHVTDDEFDAANPASLSKKQIARLRSFGFNGVTISDDLQMGAIANNYDLNQSVIMAINAGIDVLLFANVLSSDPDIPNKVREITQNALENGEIDLTRIEESYMRIINTKKKSLQ